MVDTMMSDYFARNRTAGHVCVLEEDDGEPLAVAYYEPATATDRTWYLTMIGVRSDLQGQRHGGLLMQHVEADLRDQEQRLLLVETSGVASFEKTRAFYVKCGYEREARVRNYYEPGDDMILFAKALRN